MYEAKLIADSICEGMRLTTIQLTHWKLLDGEMQKHQAMASNSSSARAIPLKIAIDKVKNNPFIPIYWGKNRSGMSATEEIEDKWIAKELWFQARDNAVDIAEKLELMGLHKQIPSRILAPFEWITSCITGDQFGWSNLFAQRCHEDAQPEMQHGIYLAQKVYFESTPVSRKPKEWHLPYVSEEERKEYNMEDLIKISCGRTARTSYLTQEGTRDHNKDIDLHDRLVNNNPKHMSPTAQIAQATPYKQKIGKYYGWTEYRKFIPNESIRDFKPNYKEYFGE